MAIGQWDGRKDADRDKHREGDHDRYRVPSSGAPRQAPHSSWILGDGINEHDLKRYVKEHIDRDGSVTICRGRNGQPGFEINAKFPLNSRELHQIRNLLRSR